MENIALAFAMDIINKGNTAIMEWFYKTVKPEESIDDMPDGTKKKICKECMKWYAEMGEYWVDDKARIIKNIQWLDSLTKKIKAYEAERTIMKANGLC